MSLDDRDLTHLSLRGIAVYVARSAHRLRPLLVLPEEERQAGQYLAELDRAIEDAEAIATLELSEFAGLGERLRHDVAHSRLVSHIPLQTAASTIATAIARSCATTEAVIKGNAQTALSYAQFSLRATEEAARLAHVEVTVLSALRNDYVRLQAETIIAFPELGEPIDPGPLWAHGAPDWWV